MIKQLLLLINMLGIMLFNNIFSDDVTITMQTPTTVDAGSEIYVEIKLNKSDFASFARFQQEIPAGLTPEPVTTSNADFSFKDQKIKFIWLKIPADKQLTIAYKLKVDERLKGNFDLSGKFSYIANNQRKHVDVMAKAVTINPSQNIDPNLIVDVSEFKTLVTPAKTFTRDASMVTCIRQKPYDNGNNEYQVNFLVNKGNKEKFAKIQETVPDGYTAVSIENKEGLYSFNDQVVKFLWMNLPAEPNFVVSYKLIPDEGVTEPPSLSGTFSFIENDNTINIDIIEKDLNVSDLSQEDINNLIVSLPVTQPTMPVSDYVPGDYSGKVKIEIAEKARRLLENDLKSFMLEPENGVYYRVQVAAGHKPINIERYFRKYNLDKEVRSELHEGWRKYSVGSFDVYKSARDYRQHIWNTTTIDDAFVSAYNNGQRITVQEALMITNHKWYR